MKPDKLGTLPVTHQKTVDKLVPKAFVRLKGHQWIVLDCPFCGQKHSHGAGENPLDYLGFRVSHCIGKKCQNYELVLNDS